MSTQSSVTHPIQRNIAAIDAADFGLDFIDRYAIPLAQAIRLHSAKHSDSHALCQLLYQEAKAYRALLLNMREREGG